MGSGMRWVAVSVVGAATRKFEAFGTRGGSPASSKMRTDRGSMIRSKTPPARMLANYAGMSVGLDIAAAHRAALRKLKCRYIL